MGVRVALAQINTTVGDIDGNWGKILNGIQEAKDEGCDIIVFPELAICGYPPEDLLLRKSFLHECHSSVLNLAKHANGITALVGSPWKYKWGEHRRSYNHNGEELYNAAVLMSQGKIQDIYFKTELPNYGPFDEKRYFSRLDDPECLVFIMNGLRFNITICEDVWIWPSPVQTLAGMNDVDVTLNLSASPFYVNKLEDRSYVLQKFCEHTGSSMVYTNLVGCQDELIFDGSSMVLDAWGGVQHMAERFQEDLMIVDLDAETYTRKREDRGYLFRDYYGTTATIERTFAYVVEPNTLPEVHKSHKSNTTFFEGWLHGDAENEEMWGALVLGIKDYVTKNGFTDVVLGVSGGIDSSVVLALAVEALGHEHVHAISMPSWVSSEDTRNDAQILAKNFEVHFEEIHKIGRAHV